jgi:hypothetical protein
MLENFVLKIYTESSSAQVSASLSAQVTVSHKKMLNKSATHNQRTAFSSMTVWMKIRNTNRIFCHAGKFCPQNLY